MRRISVTLVLFVIPLFVGQITAHPTIVSGLILNEVELNPQGADGGREWVELYNPTDGLVDLYGWWIAPQWDRSRAFQIQDHLLMSPRSYVVIQHERLLFFNRDETVVLLDPDMNEVDRTPGPLSDDPGTSGDNRCWARVPDARDANQFRDWKYVDCTPGLPNPTSL